MKVGCVCEKAYNPGWFEAESYSVDVAAFTVSEEFTALEQRNQMAMETFLALPGWRLFARHRAFRHWRRAEAEFGVALSRERPWTHDRR